MPDISEVVLRRVSLCCLGQVCKCYMGDLALSAGGLRSCSYTEQYRPRWRFVLNKGFDTSLKTRRVYLNILCWVDSICIYRLDILTYYVFYDSLILYLKFQYLILGDPCHSNSINDCFSLVWKHSFTYCPKPALPIKITMNWSLVTFLMLYGSFMNALCFKRSHF